MILSIFSKRKNVETLTGEPDVLWAYPLDRFVNKDEPFEKLEPPQTRIRADMINLCHAASIGYIFQYYYVLLYKIFGADVAAVVAAEHVSRLNAATPGFGDDLTYLIRLIQDGMDSSERHSYRLPESGVELPMEFYVATHILFAVKDSPFFDQVDLLTKENGLPTQEVHEATFDVAECLVWNRDKSVEHFGGMLNILKIDAASLKSWIDAKCQVSTGP